MIKKLNTKYVIIGHSDNRAEGDNDIMLKNKVTFALKNKLKVIFCIGENKKERLNKLTSKILKKQLLLLVIKNMKQAPPRLLK